MAAGRVQHLFNLYLHLKKKFTCNYKKKLCVGVIGLQLVEKSLLVLAARAFFSNCFYFIHEIIHEMTMLRTEITFLAKTAFLKLETEHCIFEKQPLH